MIFVMVDGWFIIIIIIQRNGIARDGREQCTIDFVQTILLAGDV